MHGQIVARPFVKWAGGKRELVPILVKRVPDEFGDYHEPFVGGGALYFHLVQKYPDHRYHISDVNGDLINTYVVVRDHVEELIELLKVHQQEHCKEHYYQVRSQHELEGPVERAARFIYLNRTCFNGLYRVNRRGEFNVPMGSYRNPDVVQEENLRAVSEVLQGTEISVRDFQEISPRAGDLVYLDPPYHPLSATSSFTSYTQEGFGEQMQVELAEFVRRLDRDGVYFMLSNSDTEFTRELFAGFNFETVYVRRQVNSKAGGRGPIEEILVRNYS